MESFLDEPVDVRVVTDGRIAALRDLEAEAVLPGEKIAGPPGGFPLPDAGKTVFETRIKPHSYRAFRAE